MSIESFPSTAAILGGGFFVGILIEYALKKVIKMVAVIVGLFLAGLAYLQYHQIANINCGINFKEFQMVLLRHFQMCLLYKFKVVAMAMRLLLQQPPH
jgi:uncharacterized membrane protein (Fun14 family)